MIWLTSDEVERRFQVLGIPNRFTQEEKQLFTTTDIVRDHKDLLAFPVPAGNAGLNILNLRRLLGTNPSKQPCFFDHPWFLDEPFAVEDCSPGWHVLYTTVLQDSVSQPLNYGISLNARNLELPTAVEVALMIFLHYVGTGVQLLHNKHTWCKDRASMNRWVTVGAFGRNGLFVSSHPPNFTSRGLGVCPRVRRTRDGVF